MLTELLSSLFSLNISRVVIVDFLWIKFVVLSLVYSTKIIVGCNQCRLEYIGKLGGCLRLPNKRRLYQLTNIIFIYIYYPKFKKKRKKEKKDPTLLSNRMYFLLKRPKEDLTHCIPRGNILMLLRGNPLLILGLFPL